MFATYQFDDTDRSNAQVGHSWTNTGTLGVSSMLGPVFQGRTSTPSSTAAACWITGRRGRICPLATATSQDYAVRRLLPGSDDRERGQPPLRLCARRRFLRRHTIQGEEDDFHYPSTTENAPPGTAPGNLLNQIEGIKHDYNLTAGIDGNYRMAADLNFHADYTYEQIFYDNLGNGDCAIPPAPPSPQLEFARPAAGYFQNKYTSGVHSAGLSAEWQATDRLKIGANSTRLRTARSCSASSMASS